MLAARCDSEGSLEWRFTQGEMFDDMDRSLPSESQVSCRASTTSLGRQPSRSLLDEDVGVGGGVSLLYWFPI